MTPRRISYVNGRYVPHTEAMVHIEDRGYQFADGIYEVMAVINGVILDEDRHLERLERSLSELAIPLPCSISALKHITRELLRQNRREHALLYMQITRGVMARNHHFPENTLTPSLTITVSAPRTPPLAVYEKGVTVITQPDLRWARRDIKSIALLPNALAKQAAALADAREAWLIDASQMVIEGSASNCYIITAEGVLITHPATEAILGGITRQVALELATALGITIEERPFSIKEAHAAPEAFLTSSTAGVLPVVKMDDIIIGPGTPGKTTQQLIEQYDHYVREQTGLPFRQ